MESLSYGKPSSSICCIIVQSNRDVETWKFNTPGEETRCLWPQVFTSKKWLKRIEADRLGQFERNSDK